MQRFMAERGLAGAYACPALPPLAHEAIAVVEKDYVGKGTCFIGSSLGGFYATYLAEKHGLKATLINPAIDPHVGLRAYLGPQQNLHTGEPYELTEAHLQEWEKLYVPRITPQRYLLIVETGDEVLDYRKAVERYAGAEQVVVSGGDHSLVSFPQHLPRILEFSRAAAL
ncbi:MAG TPA: YqiA/YcfP family alpha/beta fold hydrolase [Burkholderiales bacterium]|nr:YqiA/YcfP family alpha/beta fold hydrolase [Burkholderiales bacterium]